MLKAICFHKGEFDDFERLTSRVNDRLSDLAVEDTDIVSIHWRGDYLGVWYRTPKTAELAATDSQQLKREIAALANEIETDMDTGSAPYNHHRIVAILRQLSRD